MHSGSGSAMQKVAVLVLHHYRVPDPDAHQNEKPDPYAHQPEKPRAVKSHNGAMKARPWRLTIKS
jgi:hypothetical protein